MCVVLQCVQSWQYWMRHLESLPVLFIPESTQLIRDAAGKSQEVKENASIWSLKTWTLAFGMRRAVMVIWKLKMIPIPVIRLVEKYVDMGIKMQRFFHLSRTWWFCLSLIHGPCGVVDLKLLTIKWPLKTSRPVRSDQEKIITWVSVC